MTSTIKVDKLDPQSGTALEIGTSGDTVTVPSGVGLTLTDSTLLLPTTVTATTEVKTNKISPATGTAFALGDSGDTITVPSGATITNNGTQTGFGGTMTPAFQATAPADQAYSAATMTVIPANTEEYDTDSAYDTSTYRFTPQVAGKYFCYIQLTASNDAQELKTVITTVRKNGNNNYQHFMMPDSSDNARKLGVFQGLVLDLDGSTDYFEAAIDIDGSSGSNSTDYSRIGAYKIIE